MCIEGQASGERKSSYYLLVFSVSEKVYADHGLTAYLTGI